MSDISDLQHKDQNSFLVYILIAAVCVFMTYKNIHCNAYRLCVYKKNQHARKSTSQNKI